MQLKPDRRQGMQRHPVPLDCGLYATHLQQYFQGFPREQVRIYLYEDYRADARAVLRDIFGFLGVCGDPPKSGPLVMLVRGPKKSPARARPRGRRWRGT